MNTVKKRILSGITPSGDGSLHIGNYLGAVRQFVELSKNNECFLFVADIHALTTIQRKDELRANIETLILNELALLGDLSNIIFFRQSDVPMHTELQTISLLWDLLKEHMPIRINLRRESKRKRLTWVFFLIRY